MEQGIGYFSSRADELSGLEVVLGNGTVLRTGFGHYENSEVTHVHRHGVGPSLDGIFAQGNFGVVTQAGVRLMTRPECAAAVVCRLPDDGGLPCFIDAWASLYRQGVLSYVTHIGNTHRTEAALGPRIAESIAAEEGLSGDELRERVAAFLDQKGYRGWSAIVGLSGPRSMVQSAYKEIRRALAGIACPALLTEPKVDRILCAARRLPFLKGTRAVLSSVQEIFGLARGIPTSEPMKSLYWPLEMEPSDAENPEPDRDPFGMIYVLPMMPLSGGNAVQAAGMIDAILGEAGFTPYLTFNVIDSRTLEAVVNICFDRRDAARTDAARSTMRWLQEAFMPRGWYPYRLSIDTMDLMINEQDPFW
jgi:4-cresol dehydrogenase (hydroxylating)